MTNEARFWDRIAERYAKRAVPDQSAYEKKLEVTRRYLTPDSEVLEFGCGTGSTALLHAPLVKHVHAIDFSEKMIAIAERKRLEAKVRNVSFECRSIEALDAAGRRYDVVMGLNVLHLVQDWKLTIANVRRLLKPGGVFVSSTACMGDSMAWFKYVLPLGRAFGVLPNLAIFTTGDLEQALREAGFEIEHEWQPGKNKAVFIVARSAR